MLLLPHGLCSNVSPRSQINMSVYFEVDLFQLNAARNCAGDSAIVLLVARTEPPQTDKRGAIKSAVLIDGGNGKEVGDLIEDVIVWIQTQYTMTTDYLEFDSVIITHYDAVSLSCSGSNSHKEQITDDRRIIRSWQDPCPR